MTQEFLNRTGWKFKSQNGHYITTCPYCGKGDHFYINSDHGAWDCKKCGKSGSLYSLKLEFDPEKVFIKNEPKIKYLDNTPTLTHDNSQKYLRDIRKIDESLFLQQKLIFSENGIGFPYNDKQGRTYTIKWRNIKEKKFIFKPNSPIYFPYNIDNIDSAKNKTLVICEGEIDTLSWLTYGFKNVIGIPGADSFKGEWINLVKDFKQLYVSLDMDDAGRRGTQKIIDKLKDFMAIKVIELPENDINDCLKKGIPKSEIEKCIDNSRIESTSDLIHIADIKLAKPTDEDFGYGTGWNNLDDLTKWRMGEFSIFTAHTKAGKSTFMTSALLNQAKRERPVLVGTFEMSIESIKRKIFALIMGKNYFSPSVTQADIDKADKIYSSLPITFINHYGAMPIEKLISIIKYSDKYFDTKFVLLDHLSYMVDFSANNAVHEIGSTLRQIKALNNQLRNHTWLICHPAKTTSESEINEFTLRGSAEISQICDQLFIIRANKENKTTEVELKLARNELTNPGKVVFDYNVESLNYSERIPKPFQEKYSEKNNS